MKLIDLTPHQLHRLLQREGLTFCTGPFSFRLHSPAADLSTQLHYLYADYLFVDNAKFSDFHIKISRHSGWWRSRKPWMLFETDIDTPYRPFAEDSILPFLEWGINWCVASQAHCYLMLHTGALEKNGNTLLLPAHPGSGKSTLCAALCHRGWRLLTDEIALVRPADLALVPFPRLIALKNQSIAVFREFIPEAVLGPEYPNTPKGTVCHVRPPMDSIERSDETGRARWIVLPKFKAGASLALKPLDKTEAFIQLTGHSFNYELIGLRGFQAMTGLIDACDCYTFEYGGDLEQAVAQLNALADGLIERSRSA
ncbi:MAG: HprK-related kinase A [Candidatus Competibacter sp.]|nr:HprK-related kinase A [Candidatus Competibacter sp.]MDG4606534.1 HprK-related kinase A [Candidatus Contendobacter sp.]HRD50603.1 HprK-related kinase A [Candidatus Contendobacter sp.]